MIGTAGAGALLLAQPAGHLEAVEVGQHHVEHDEVGAAALDRVQRGAAGRRPLDVEAVVAEPHRHQLGDVLLVVDDEDARLRTLDMRLRSSSGHRCGAFRRLAGFPATQRTVRAASRMELAGNDRPSDVPSDSGGRTARRRAGE